MQRTRIWTCAILFICCAGCKLDLVSCEGLIGTPWPNEKLKILEGEWQETSDDEMNRGQRDKCRFLVNAEKNCLETYRLDDSGRA